VQWVKNNPNQWPKGNSENLGERRLADWWHNQTSASRIANMSCRRIAKLEKLSPNTKRLAAFNSVWSRHYQETVRWIKNYGYGKFPTLAKERTLYFWWQKQCEREHLSEEAVLLLEDIGFLFYDPVQFSRFEEWDS